MQNTSSLDDFVFYIVPDVSNALDQLEHDPFHFDEDFAESKLSNLEVDMYFQPIKVEAEEWSGAHPSDSNNSSLTSSPTNEPETKPVVSTHGSSSTTPSRPAKRQYRKRALGQPAPWTAEEETIFLMGLDQFGCSRSETGSVGLGPGVARMLAEMIGTRTASQIRSHAQKHFQRIAKMRSC
eukprot:CAMPEP_0196722606 /NCGR_PEP_ID=MMETSP1091-20130531/4934_1 /TAXON_ID=302021 /ORGANISM="Rhodomonas sp., Strain CCMP768" /LENGTH=180 /DNA_ID=CAMNT_0042064351 /DNA_START=11 /DNA_END=553 /DNA_ORIENTATION=-